jgi:hypothetical protein
MIAQHVVISVSSEMFATYTQIYENLQMPFPRHEPEVGESILIKYDINAADTDREKI